MMRWGRDFCQGESCDYCVTRSESCLAPSRMLDGRPASLASSGGVSVGDYAIRDAWSTAGVRSRADGGARGPAGGATRIPETGEDAIHAGTEGDRPVCGGEEREAPR